MRRLVKGEPPKEFVEVLNNKDSYLGLSSWDLPSDVKRSIRKTLLKGSFGKCAYCETKIDETDSVLEHFYPRAKYSNKLYDWDNLVISCKVCNKYKAGKFPLDAKEKPLLVNPYFDDPTDHFGPTKNGKFRGKSEKGRVTINVLGLNREELLKKRKTSIIEHIPLLEKSIQDKSFIFNSLEYYQSVYYNDIEYSLCIFKSFERVYKKRKESEGKNFDGEIIKIFNDYAPRVIQESEVESPIKYFDIKNYKIQTIYIDSVVINNFKVIDKIKINFNKVSLQNTNIPCLILLGENGVGKTSILQAISLALVGIEGEDLAKRIINKNNGFKKNKNTEININLRYSELSDYSRVTVNQDQIIFKNKGQKIPVLAYSAVRIERLGNVKNQVKKFNVSPVRIYNLFQSRDVMINSNQWLVSLNNEEFKIVSDILLGLLNLDESQIIEKDSEKVYIKGKDNIFAINQFSEGRRNIIALVCDILAHMSSLWGDGKLFKEDIIDYSGVVLIDEIGAHLHPKWKMQIVKQLRTTFPKLQFICTTHDPLCLKGFKEGEIIVLRKDKNGKVFMENQEDLPNPEAMRADQILTSTYFGLSSTIDPEIEDAFDEYYDLLARDSTLSAQKIERLNSLKAFIQDKKMLGDSTREQLYFDIIDTVLAERNLGKAVNKLSLKKEVIQRINEVLKSRKI